MDQWTQKSIEEIAASFNTDTKAGLSEGQAEAARQSFGLNAFEERKKESIFSKLLNQLKDFSTLILLAAALLSLYVALTTASGDFTEPIVIMVIIVINAVLGIRQENSAERALEALRDMNAHVTVVVRDGVKQPIDARLVVPGDLLELEAGDMIPADARIVESSGLRVDESVLTGESLPVEKQADASVPVKAPIGDRLNMIFSGCLITNGSVRAVVVATGMQTEVGKIAGMLNDTKVPRTPLQQRLNSLGKKVSLLALISAAAVLAIGLAYGENFIEMLLTAVSLAVAAVPETLPVIVTITLAFGVQQMVKKHAIIRRIPAVETLGSASVICSDKTGTLTQNKMTVKELWSGSGDPMPADGSLSADDLWLLEMFALASNATIEVADGEEKVVGDPTESSVIRLLRDKGIEKSELERKYPRVLELPFDSDRKRMTTVNKMPNGRFLCITKGAFDAIPMECVDGCVRARMEHERFAQKALRVLAAAYKYYDRLPGNPDIAELENGLAFAGLIGMIDPPRETSMAAVAEAKAAGIKTVMITGDHIATASAIAREIGILEDGGLAITGEQLDEIPQDELVRRIEGFAVYARVSPEDKIRIIKAWQAKGRVVAMTGDGVNDAPALKAADVGVAMGVTGTDVAKNAADMVITDDNFATIVDAVAEGRRVYANIRKAIYFLLSCNISEILVMLVAVILGWGAPVVAVQLLLINVVADGIPGFSLSREKADRDIMREKPVGKQEGLFAGGLGARIVGMAVLFTALTLIGFYIGSFVPVSGAVAPSHEAGMTMAFVILGLSSVVHIFNARSKDSIFKIGFASNKPLLISACISIAIVVLFALIPPIARVFYLIPLDGIHWLIMIALSITPLAVSETAKAIRRRRG